MQQGSTWQHPVRPDGAENAGFLGNTDALQAPTQSPKWQHHISNGDFGQPLAHSQQPISGCRPNPAAREHITAQEQRFRTREQALKQEAERARQAAKAGYSVQDIASMLQHSQVFSSRQHSFQRGPGVANPQDRSPGSSSSSPYGSFNMPAIPAIPGIPGVPGMPAFRRAPSPSQADRAGSSNGGSSSSLQDSTRMQLRKTFDNPASSSPRTAFSQHRSQREPVVDEETWGVFHERRHRSGDDAAQDGAERRGSNVPGRQLEYVIPTSEQRTILSGLLGRAGNFGLEPSRRHADEGRPLGESGKAVSTPEPMPSPFAASTSSSGVSRQPSTDGGARGSGGLQEPRQSSHRQPAGQAADRAAGQPGGRDERASRPGQARDRSADQASTPASQASNPCDPPSSQHVGMQVCRPESERQGEATAKPPSSRSSWQDPASSSSPGEPAPAAPLTACLSGEHAMTLPAPEVSAGIPELREDEWEIDPDEIVKEKDAHGKDKCIGTGTYGNVYKAKWRHTDVALKELVTQQDDLTPRVIKEFQEEVAIMRLLRHTNVLLFLGASTRPPKLSIITQYLPRGSLFHLLHRRRDVQLDQKRCLRMGLDIARGMHYLHSCRPPIVHRDLKSPNLLVDKDFTIKVCDFGLSRVRYATLVNSRLAGTPAWTAPEVLRSEGYNEKSDCFSFGVVLWELATRQEPWSDFYDPVQVVGAVGFGGRLLEIPEDRSHPLVPLIEKCFLEPAQRPSFGDLCSELTGLIGCG